MTHTIKFFIWVIAAIALGLVAWEVWQRFFVELHRPVT